MQLDSTSAKHKLVIATLLMMLFALPFALQWRAVRSFDTSAFLAGSAAVGNSALMATDSAPSTNNIAQSSVVSGRSFAGELAR